MPSAHRRPCSRTPAAAWFAASALLCAASCAAGAPGRCVTGLSCDSVVVPDGPARLNGARGLAVDHRGGLVIADTGNHRVLILSAEGAVEREFGGYGWEEGRFDTPTDLAVHAGFYIYVLDSGNRRVQRFEIDGDYVDTVVGEDAVDAPVAIDVGRSGEIMLLDGDSQSVLVFSQFGEEMPSVGRFGAGEGGLAQPVDVAVGPRGEIAVADPGRASVEVFDEFGTHAFSLGAPDSLGAVAVVFDARSNVLVADATHGRIVAFSPTGLLTAVLDGDSEGAPFRPADLAMTPDGRLLVLDGTAGRVLSVTMDYGDCRALR